MYGGRFKLDRVHILSWLFSLSTPDPKWNTSISCVPVFICMHFPHGGD